MKLTANLANGLALSYCCPSHAVGLYAGACRNELSKKAHIRCTSHLVVLPSKLPSYMSSGVQHASPVSQQPATHGTA